MFKPSTRQAALAARENAFAVTQVLKGLSLTLERSVQAIERAGYRAGEDVALAVDVAATQFFVDGRYRLAADEQIGRAHV